jgi:hypothetical protein
MIYFSKSESRGLFIAHNVGIISVINVGCLLIVSITSEVSLTHAVPPETT